MENKSKQLFLLLDSVYNDPDIKEPIFKKIVLEAAGRLDKDEKYEDVVSVLSREISKNRKNIPDKLLEIYKKIQPDVKPLKLDSKKLRDQAIAYGTMS